MQAQAAFDFCQRRVRAKKPERLFFAAMPADNGTFALNEFVGRFLMANDLDGAPVKPIVVLQRLAESTGPVLYGAKLAGQAVAAAGLVLAFDAVASVTTPDGRVLALTGSDPTLAAVHGALAAAIARNRLRAVEGPGPFIALATGTPRLAPQAIKPLKIRVSGLALLRGDAVGAFQVLRRWPLNRKRPPS